MKHPNPKSIFPIILFGVAMIFSEKALCQKTIPIGEEPPGIEEPFSFLGPDTAGLTFASGSAVLLRWQGGNNPNQRVQVKFSANNGHTFNYLLAAGIPVAAKQVWVTLPDVITDAGRFRLMATGSGDSTRTDTSSNPVTLSASLFCMPSAMISSDGFISNVRILNASGTVLFANPSLNILNTGYVNYVGSTPVPNLTRSSSTRTTSFSLEVTTAGVLSAQPKNVAIWIDYNNDNQFSSSGPEFLGSFSATTGTSFRRTFSIPSTVTTGIKRVRVRLVQNTLYTISGSAACQVSFPALTGTSTTISGETEDYSINVVSPVITARLAADPTVPDEEHHPEIHVFPNPVKAGNVPAVELTVPSQEEAQVVLMDLNGRVMENRMVMAGQTVVQFHTPLSSGLYLIRFDGPGRNLVRRLLVE